MHVIGYNGMAGDPLKIENGASGLHVVRKRPPFTHGGALVPHRRGHIGIVSNDMHGDASLLEIENGDPRSSVERPTPVLALEDAFRHNAVVRRDPYQAIGARDGPGRHVVRESPPL